MLETAIEQMIGRQIRYCSLVAEKIRDPRLAWIRTETAAKADDREPCARHCIYHPRIVEVSEYAVSAPGS
jgi:hypothetical protein